MFWRMWHMIEAERIKAHHSPVWLAFFILPIIPAVLGTLNYWSNRDILERQWLDLWTQHTLFSAYLFLPVLLGIYCSWLWHLEHQQHNWNNVLTAPVPVGYLYAVKLLMAAVLLLFTQIWTGILFFCAGTLCGMTEAFPLMTIIDWLFCGWLGGMVICTVQLLLSLVIRNFAVPVGIALLGGIVGLAVTAKGWAVYFPYALMPTGMRANTASSTLSCGMLPFLFFSVSYIALFILLSLLYLYQTDLAAAE